MAKYLTIVLVFVAVVNFGHGMELRRTKRQSNDNENVDNTLEDRYGAVIQLGWPIWLYPLPPRSEQNVMPSSTSTTTERSTGNPTLALEPCMRNCPVTPEYNPVCGTDNKKYNNPGLLACAQACGVNVRLMRLGSCPTARTSQ